MIEALGFPSAAQSLLVIAVVLVEAVALYLGYGVVERRAAPILFETLESN